MTKKKNYIVKDLLTPKYKTRIVKPKKGKGSFKRKKNNFYNLAPICCITLEDISVPLSKLSSKDILFT